MLLKVLGGGGTPLGIGVQPAALASTHSRVAETLRAACNRETAELPTAQAPHETHARRGGQVPNSHRRHAPGQQQRLRSARARAKGRSRQRAAQAGGTPPPAHAPAGGRPRRHPAWARRGRGPARRRRPLRLPAGLPAAKRTLHYANFSCCCSMSAACERGTVLYLVQRTLACWPH